MLEQTPEFLLLKDGVFVGSGTQLVAPLEVGDGAFIGAGSVITSDAPAGDGGEVGQAG